MIFITGATGFVGRNLVEELLRRSFKLRCLVRDTDKASWLRGLGCELVKGDVTDAASVTAGLTQGVTTVIHLVGILFETKGAGRELPSSFEDIHVIGARNVVEACKAKGVTRYLHVSALGARPGARSRYHKTKWAGEEIVRASGLEYTIFRPSVIFGKEDKFTNMFARAMRLTPVFMVPGPGKNKMSPVYVKDLVCAMADSPANEGAKRKTFEIGGQQILTLDEIIDAIAAAIGRRIVKFHAPMPFMNLAAAVFEAFLARPPITRDTLLMLEEDNVAGENALTGFFNLKPVGFSEGIKAYL
ncbi:MAG: complex I NDUFA9 subunit family protein [Deltaproteobacteria bacterium]|nr:complex I NDUFA9 subunit family protein [Deltaproteobacteria bacterium]